MKLMMKMLSRDDYLIHITSPLVSPYCQSLIQLFLTFPFSTLPGSSIIPKLEQDTILIDF